MLIAELVEQFLAERDCCPEYQRQIRHRVGSFATHSGLAKLADIELQHVNAWLAGLKGVKPITRRGYRQAILAVLNYAADVGEMERMDARRIRSPRVSHECPRAYTIDQVRALMAAATRMPGAYRWGPPQSAYWRAIIAAAYDSGLRRSDLFALRREQLDATVVIAQRKTGHLVLTGFHPNTLSLVLSLPGERPLWFRQSTREFCRHYQMVTLIAGVGGTFRWLRRTSGTLAGPAHLGHRSEAVFHRHYNDVRILETPQLPPSLAGA